MNPNNFSKYIQQSLTKGTFTHYTRKTEYNQQNKLN